MNCAGNLPDGCSDPSDLDYYERVNGPDEDPQCDDEDEDDDVPELDKEYEDWLDDFYRNQPDAECAYRDMTRLGS